MKRLGLGIDVGGTFTDIVVHDPASGSQVSHKELTTHDDPADAVITLTKPQLLALLGGAELDPAIVQGDASAIATIIGFTDEPDPRFEVVAP